MNWLGLSCSKICPKAQRRLLVVAGPSHHFFKSKARFLTSRAYRTVQPEGVKLRDMRFNQVLKDLIQSQTYGNWLLLLWKIVNRSGQRMRNWRLEELALNPQMKAKVLFLAGQSRHLQEHMNKVQARSPQKDPLILILNQIRVNQQLIH